MDVTSDGKWFWVEPTDVPLTAAAARILDVRLADVRKYLPLAARRHADDVEYVHQLRVSCRRSDAALRAFKPIVGWRGRKLKRWLQRLRRAAGPARDADVLAARLRSELDLENPYARDIIAIIDQSRVEAQREIMAVDAKASQGGLQRAVAKSVHFLRNNDDRDGDSFQAYARAVVRASAKPLGVGVSHTAVPAEFHQLRIAAKRLRYLIEIFHSAAAPVLRHDVYPIIEEMQDRLGGLNDRLASQWRFQQWLAGLPADGLAAFAASVIVAEHAAAERLRDEFLAWWTPERQSQLREQLAASFDA
jgi:CHAD domain-containing protein